MWVHGLSVPLGMPDLGVAVRPERGCELGGNDSLVVWLRPYTTLSSCPSGQLRDWAGEWVNCCHDLEVSTCLPGTRLAGCPALEQSSECVEGTEGAAQVAFDRANRVQRNESICAWECGQEFFHFECGCVNCSTQGLACTPGQRWQACSERTDASWAACPDLRLAKGSFAANEQWAEGDECVSECRAGFYNDTTQYAEGRCRSCWDRTELALHTGLDQQFLALFACNTTSNMLWSPCAQESGARVARTGRLRVAAGVVRDHLPAAVTEHARAQQHRRGQLRPATRSLGRAKHIVTHILRRFTVKPILFALPRTNKFGLEN
jgi:hypothetical protein